MRWTVRPCSMTLTQLRWCFIPSCFASTWRDLRYLTTGVSMRSPPAGTIPLRVLTIFFILSPSAAGTACSMNCLPSWRRTPDHIVVVVVFFLLPSSATHRRPPPRCLGTGSSGPHGREFQRHRDSESRTCVRATERWNVTRLL